ncbi:NAD(P)-dependent oxidoreductase [Sulfurimonas sp.]|uniref:NAD(P)-dependent oxidoreductase n=1 Tax=Sulfurimonas sp. TaxID=2022749 RepID=UPI0025F481F2|nr:NAD(P)-dependent oxidoreductase [Sulfurimonas sp.]
MIIFTETLPQEQETLLGLIDKKYHVNLCFFEESITALNAGLFSEATLLCVFIHSRVDSATLAQLPHLKAVVTRSTGTDHIDIETCKKHKIAVGNVPSYGQNTVAEYAFTLILTLARQVKPMVERLSRGEFCRDGLKGFDLFGKTIGVIGTGKIGSHVVSIARGFGMEVLCHAHHEDADLVKLSHVNYVPLETLLLQSDIVTLHIPANPSTLHLINKENILLMKPSAMLINTARGNVVEIEAIVEQLHLGNLQGGVGLDTFESEDIWIEEKYLKNDTLSAQELQKAMLAFSILRSSNVVLSPHNAYNTTEALERILAMSVENIHAFLENGTLITPVI